MSGIPLHPSVFGEAFEQIHEMLDIDLPTYYPRRGPSC